MDFKSSESKLVRSGIVVEGESGSEISLQMLNFFEIGQKSSVNSLLNLFGFSSPSGLGLFKLLLSFSSGFRSVFQFRRSVFLVWFEPGVIDFADINSVQSDFSWSGNGISGIDSFKGNSVDRVGSWNQEVAWGKSFQDNYSSSSVLSWKDNDNWSGCDISSLSWFWLVSFSFEMSLLIIGWVPGIGLVSDFLSLRSSMSYDYDIKYWDGWLREVERCPWDWGVRVWLWHTWPICGWVWLDGFFFMLPLVICDE